MLSGIPDNIATEFIQPRIILGVRTVFQQNFYPMGKFFHRKKMAKNVF
jgi:hypothetical protein